MVQPNWILPANPRWAASDEEQAEIDLLFTDEFHHQFLIGLKRLALNKCRKKDGLLESYDIKSELCEYWTKHSLRDFKEQWLHIISGGLEECGFDVGC